ncbi:serine hydrolase domain-containing protein [Paenibacillus methanolicus]|uniref:CubicO group peptidase (Beta-lactamase class C family) n=1 Tax=Paenibacillus methanolicus TaxID=582686 RepID=A0A5S5C5R2_9BACL|nr:serine hydrolase domain-containing protein [Paenibacillus methanolicus]TYP73293.1 CubicO group peptidase (beta-lactamase class C family) [Paenibacillus methanolicus]
MDFTPLSRFIDRITAWRIPWAELLVMHRNETVFRYRAGFADLEAKTPIEEDPMIYLYSLTKILTCTAALQLVEKGTILLGDPLSAYLPEFAEMEVRKKQMDDSFATELAERPITVRDLFTMTAGFSYDLAAPSIREAVERTNGRLPTREFAMALAKEPLLFEPGTRWNYSLCHDVLAALAEEVDGRRFSAYVRAEITGPLGMRDTGFDLSEAQRSRLVPQYQYDDALGKTVPMDGDWYRIGTEFESGGAGLLSTVSDYSRFPNTLTNRGTSPEGVRILSAASVDLMRCDHLTELTRSDYNWAHHAGYGFGLGVRTHISQAGSGSLSPLGEFGWSGAAGSFAIMDLESQLTVMYAQHLVNNQEPYVHPRLKNIVYACLK